MALLTVNNLLKFRYTFTSLTVHSRAIPQCLTLSIPQNYPLRNKIP